MEKENKFSLRYTATGSVIEEQEDSAGVSKMTDQEIQAKALDILRPYLDEDVTELKVTMSPSQNQPIIKRTVFFQ